MRTIELLLDRMPNLSELHLASNNYSRVTFATDYRKESLKVLYLNNNNFSAWCEVLKFGKCFPMLENLVLSDNPLSSFVAESEALSTAECFRNVEILILNKVNNLTLGSTLMLDFSSYHTEKNIEIFIARNG